MTHLTPSVIKQLAACTSTVRIHRMVQFILNKMTETAKTKCRSYIVISPLEKRHILYDTNRYEYKIDIKYSEDLQQIVEEAINILEEMGFVIEIVSKCDVKTTGYWFWRDIQTSYYDAGFKVTAL